MRLRALVLASLLAAPALALRPPSPEEIAARQEAMRPPYLRDNADAKFVAAASNGFGMKVYRRLAAAETGNVVFSPFSLSAVLAMTWTGATGPTREEMARALELGDDERRVLDGWKATLGCYDREGSPAATANRIFADTSAAPKLEWQRVLEETFRSDVRTVDYRFPKAAADEINAWVNQATKGMVPELLAESDLAPDPVTNMPKELTLVDTAHYSGAWIEPFEKTATTDAPFTHADGSRADVQTMHRTGFFAYGETARWQTLAMPLKAPQDTAGGTGDTPLAGWRGRISMLFLLPRAEESRAAIESEMDADAVASALAAGVGQRVEVSLPKFAFAHSMRKLADDLKALGMAGAFEDSAQFGGIGAAPLKIDDVIQNAAVMIDENGAEAAAATAVIMSVPAAAEPPEEIPEFRADHPFLWFIVDEQTGAILFAGRTAEPR